MSFYPIGCTGTYVMQEKPLLPLYARLYRYKTDMELYLCKGTAPKPTPEYVKPKGTLPKTTASAPKPAPAHKTQRHYAKRFHTRISI